jgi:hypothetical protein
VSPTIVALELDRDAAPGRRELDGIRQELFDDLLEGTRIAHHRSQPGRDHTERFFRRPQPGRWHGATSVEMARLSSVTVTLCLTDYLASYPDAMIHVHNLGGNIPAPRGVLVRNAALGVQLALVAVESTLGSCSPTPGGRKSRH